MTNDRRLSLRIGWEQVASRSSEPPPSDGISPTVVPLAPVDWCGTKQVPPARLWYTERALGPRRDRRSSEERGLPNDGLGGGAARAGRAHGPAPGILPAQENRLSGRMKTGRGRTPPGAEPQTSLQVWPSGPWSKLIHHLARDSSRLAALLLRYVRPVRAVVAPCQPRASHANLTN